MVKNRSSALSSGNCRCRYLLGLWNILCVEGCGLYRLREIFHFSAVFGFYPELRRQRFYSPKSLRCGDRPVGREGSDADDPNVPGDTLSSPRVAPEKSQCVEEPSGPQPHVPLDDLPRDPFSLPSLRCQTCMCRTDGHLLY